MPVLIAVVLLLAGALPDPCCYSRDDNELRILEVDGTGRVINDDFARGRTEAIRQALRRAVEETTALWLPAPLPESKARAVKEALDARSEGYIQNYRIIAEKPSGNSYSVVVRATVSAANIKRDLQMLGLLTASPAEDRTVSVTLTIRDLVSYADYLKLKNMLKFKLGSVKDVSERQVQWKMVTMDLRISGTTRAVAAELADKSPLPLEIRNVDRDSIDIAVIH